MPDTSPSAPPHVVFICTGNAARSVMGGAILAAVDPEIAVTTVGTHVVEGQPISWRTREALAGIGLVADTHRSRQLSAAHVDTADILVGFEAIHVGYVRRNFPDAAAKAATLKYLVDHLRPNGDGLAGRLGELGLESIALDQQADVTDPAGGEVDDYKACAAEVDYLVRELLPRLL